MDSNKFTETVEKFVHVREQRDKLDAEYKSMKAEIDAEIDDLRYELRQYMQHSGGMTSIKTDVGTVTMVHTTKFILTDSHAFVDHIRQTGEIELLQMRIAPNNLKKYIEIHGMPEGVEQETHADVRITAK